MKCGFGGKMKVVEKIHFGSYRYNIAPTLHERKINFTTLLKKRPPHKTLMHGIYHLVKYAQNFV